MNESEVHLYSFIDSDERVLSLDGCEVTIDYDEGEITIVAIEYRDTEKFDERRGESLEIRLTENQVARMSQIISDWLNSRTQGSFDKLVGTVEGDVIVFTDDGDETMTVEELRIALDRRGVFLTPGTGSSWPTQIRIPENREEETGNICHFKNLLLDILELSTASQEESLQNSQNHQFKYDVFICHSSNDKSVIVEPLADELDSIGLNVWYDNFEISIGDDIREAIEEGIMDSRYGVIVLSEDFIEADWAAAEMPSLTAREHSEDVQKILLPIRYNIEMDVVREETPLLASRLAPSVSEENISEIAEQIKSVVVND